MTPQPFLSSLLPRFSVIVASAITSQAATVIVDSFDSGVASTAWDTNLNTSIIAGGALSSTNALSLSAAPNNPGLGESFGSATGGLGAEDFVIDFYFRVQTSTNRQFSLIVSNTSTTVNVNSATINLRYQSGGFALFAGGVWNSLSTLGSITAGDWYHMQVEGINFGTPTGSYTIRLSDADDVAFAQEVSGLTFAQNGSVTGNLAQSFVFSTAFGSNPGFSVDNISVTTGPIPEPSSAVLGGMALLGLLRRRR